jgi:hypothetical protein
MICSHQWVATGNVWSKLRIAGKHFSIKKEKVGVKWIDILNMYSKNERIHGYNENIVKTKSINKGF